MWAEFIRLFGRWARELTETTGESFRLYIYRRAKFFLELGGDFVSFVPGQFLCR
jgi:hypothetical protein